MEGLFGVCIFVLVVDFRLFDGFFVIFLNRKYLGIDKFLGKVNEG